MVAVTLLGALGWLGLLLVAMTAVALVIWVMSDGWPFT
jgi:hypothetical protein